MTRSRDTANTQDNLGGAVAPFVAGKNKIINGDFGIWQRGTSFAISANAAYGPDRFFCDSGSLNYTFSQQTFTPGTAPVAGYEGKYFLRAAATSGSGGYPKIYQKIEDVRTFAGQTVTFSFWIKASGATSAPYFQAIQYFGTGGSPSANTYSTIQGISVTTSWQRVSYTITLPSLSGTTIGTNNDSWVAFLLNLPTSGTLSIDTWGWQVEAGSVATPFTPAGGGFPGAELALCQRYYFRHTASASYSRFATVWGANATQLYGYLQLPVPMRANPTVLEVSTASLFQIFDGSTNITVTGFGVDQMDYLTPSFSATVASGLTTARAYQLLANNNTSAYIAFGAEL